MALNGKMKASTSRYMNGLILSLLYSIAVAVVPPHPNAEFDSSFPRFTNRRGLLGTEEQMYETKLLHPELCRFEDFETCQSLDEVLQRHSRRTLTSINSRGRLKVLVILLRFHDHRSRDVIEPSDVQKFFNADGLNRTIYPTGSIKTYLRVNSYKSLTVDADVISWFATDKTEKECSGGASGLSQDFKACFTPILEQLDALHGNPENAFTWDKYDEDQNGVIDSLVVMHSGYGAEHGNKDPSGASPEDRIWTHSMGAQQKDLWNSIHGQYSIGTYTVASVFDGLGGNNITKIGVVLHELLHSFSLKHLYDVGRSDRGGGVGAYSIMSNPWGQSNDGSFPGSLDPWSKIQLGWLTPKRITQSGSYSMQPSATTQDVYLIDNPYPLGEHLLIENRQKTLYDGKMLDGAGGALIWHVDETKSANSQPGGPYQEGWPQNGNHYKVALLQADGLYQLEQNINVGDVQDFFTDGATLGPGSTGVFPNTDSYQNGNVISNNMTITGFVQQKRVVRFIVRDYPKTVNQIGGLRKCSVNVNLGQCSSYMTDNVLLLESDCDCYNFCGNSNGAALGCCKFGEPCPIACDSGGLVAGCTLPVVNVTDPPSVDPDDVVGVAPPKDDTPSSAPALRWYSLVTTPILLVLGSLVLHI